MFNISNARTQALANGLVDVLQVGRREFKSSKEIILATTALENEILKDWSS